MEAPLTNQLKIVSEKQRLHGFDAIRAGAMLLVILLHAAVPYVVNPMPGLLWPTRDAAPNLAVDGLFWSIECFIMALFFVISGYFAAQLCIRRGLAGYLRQRSRRLLAPLLLATLIILPLTGYVWVFGWVLEGKVAAIKLRSFKFEDSVAADLFGFAHLWYLQYLTVYCFAFAGLLAVSRALFPARANGESSESKQATVGWWFPISAIIGGMALLAIDPEIILGFQQSILPVATRLAFYGLLFGVGVWLFHNGHVIATLQRQATRMVAAATLLFAVSFPLLLSHFNGELQLPGRITLAIVVTLFAWLMTAGVLGGCTLLFSRKNPVLRYLADASFWAYLTHLPIVGALHIALAQTNLPVGMKLALSFGGAVAIAIFSYQLLVCRWRVGAWLNGGAPPRKATAEIPAETPSGQPVLTPSQYYSRSA